MKNTFKLVLKDVKSPRDAFSIGEVNIDLSHEASAEEMDVMFKGIILTCKMMFEVIKEVEGINKKGPLSGTN
jgi:hypothetical protein